MSHKLSLIVAAALLTFGLAAGGAYAEQGQTTQPQGAESGMMGTGTTMGQAGGMQGMQGMMAQESRMMDTCNSMMTSATRTPNSQWQKSNPPPAPKG